MRNLFRFLARNYFFLLFLALESFSLVLVVNFNNFQKVQFLNSSNSFSAGIFSKVSSFYDYFYLKKVNNQLSEENARLKNELQKYDLNMFTVKIDSVSNDSIQVFMTRKDVILKDDSANFLYITAKVVNNSVNKQYNYITLNKGRKDGVKADMGIVGPLGVVGIITNVSDHYSTGPTVLNTRWKVSAKIKKNNNFGSLAWDGFNPAVAKLNEIPYHVVLEEGDTIVTSGYSSVFPEGIMVGTIESYNRESGDNFYEIFVNLSTDFMTLTHVNVIKNDELKEITNVEENNVNE